MWGWFESDLHWVPPPSLLLSRPQAWLHLQYLLFRLLLFQWQWKLGGGGSGPSQSSKGQGHHSSEPLCDGFRSKYSTLAHRALNSGTDSFNFTMHFSLWGKMQDSYIYGQPLYHLPEPKLVIYSNTTTFKCFSPLFFLPYFFPQGIGRWQSGTGQHYCLFTTAVGKR